MSETDIAIIGMAGRFPGAADLRAFWKNVRGGVESIRWFSDDELLALGETAAHLAEPGYVRACPVLDDLDKFDAGFFGFSPREAAITDPQHRIFLETAWAAMEDAGLVPERYEGTVGVWASCGLNAYLMHHLVTNRELLDTVGEWLLRHMGNDPNFLATRVSYEFDLRGPSMNVQTACSSSLVAIHQAAQSLLAGECDTALAGGATLSLPVAGYVHREGEILSADGHCRPFDARSSGTLFGSGVGAVVLRRLADAQKNGDAIWGVIRGSAINNDGSRKVGFLAPSVDGQASAIAEALAIAGLEPDAISYVEAHGTGTLVGDPIEVSALVQAYREGTSRRQFCGLGSLKGNIGHLGEAAGVAGFIKTVLALHHRELPPSLGYERPNPAIDFAASPFFVVDRLRPWTAEVRRAGITALGAGGTNAHVIVEEAPAAPAPAASRGAQLLVLSARTPAALDAAAKNLAEHLDAETLPLADVAHTLAVRRRAFAHRRAVVGTDAKALLSAKTVAAGDAKVVFLFAGGGAQYAGMGRELYDREPVYRAAVDECLGAPDLPAGLREVLLSPGPALEAPSLALPALFATELAMARLLESFGVEASAMIGHSMGEYVAACLAGVFSARDGMRLVATRGRLFETLPAGSMLVVPQPASELALPPGLSIAAVNAPSLCVVSGPSALVRELAESLAARELETTPVHISVAAHSAMLEPILQPFEAFCRAIRLAPPKRRWVSNLTGTWISAEEATDPRYWVRHLREPVRFADGLAAILREGPAVVVEVGPGRTLASLARQQPEPPLAALTTLPHPTEGGSAANTFLATLGQLWAHGLAVDLPRLLPGRVVRLPTYPFERQRHWIERSAAVVEARSALRKVKDVGQWYWVPSWRRAAPVAAARARRRLVLVSDPAVGAGLLEHWPDAVLVTLGDAYAQTAPDRFTLDPADRAGHDALFAALAGRLPEQIVHVTEPRHVFQGLLHLAQALALEEHAAEILVAQLGDAPEHALAMGPVRVIPAELPALACRVVTVNAIAQIAAEADVTGGARVVAYRGRARFEQRFDRVPLPPGAGFREGGTYVITGGLGGVGLALADHLARRYRARLVLIGRSGLPAREEWTPSHPDARVRAMLALEAHGAEVLGAAADVADKAAMAVVLAEARARFGTLHGVLHAAGVLDDGLLQTKTAESWRRVLRPKVDGARVLDELLRGRDAPADFLVFFSSVSAVLGLQGQIDYGAANAFLDALAHDRSEREPGLTVSIDWSAWRDVGMAATLASRGRRPEAPLRRARHAWLGHVLAEGPRTVFGVELDRDEHWLLREHVVRGGEALVPGTGYLELARAAGEEVHGGTVELSNVLFLAPFVVTRGQRRPLRVVLTGDELVIGSADLDPHMTARVRARSFDPRAIAIAELQARCTERRPVTDGRLAQSFMDFGPRWQNLRAQAFGQGEALLELELDEAFAGDLEEQRLHPALLDIATGGAQALIPGFDPTRDFFVPFSYERVAIHRGLPRRLWSHIRFAKDSSPDMPAFDVTLAGEDGVVCVEVEGFVMKRAFAGALFTAAPVKEAAASTGTEMREAAFREGMLPHEGIDALERILAAGLGPQVVASSIDLEDWIAALAAPPPEPARAVTTRVDVAPPRTPTEEVVAAVWRKLLGSEAIGIHDDFFELGGHSLLLTQTVTRVRKQAGVDVPLRALLTKLTIADMAAAVDAAKAAPAPQAPAIRKLSREAFKVKRSELDKG